MNTLLFVPAIEKMIRKIPTFDADAFIVDLEDSVINEQKDTALQLVKAFLQEQSVDAEKLYVRLNQDRIRTETDALRGLRFAGYMIPKFEDPDAQFETGVCEEKRRIIALVETPKGVLNIDRIAAAPWVDAIAFGAEDFTSCVGMTNNRETLLPVRSSLVVAAKAFQKPVYDTPCFILEEEALERESEHAAGLGFDGKLAIHPKQIPVIRKVFQQCDLDYIKWVVEQYESGQAAVMKIDGRIYEKMHIAHMKRIIKERG